MRPNFSRRSFLARSAGLASASLSLGVPALALPGGSGQPLRLGWVGLGDRGLQLLEGFLGLPAMPEGPAARLVALHDPDARRVERCLERWKGARGGDPVPRVLTSDRAILESREIDAVVLATPVHLHADQVVLALQAGKHVYCEKPLGHSLEALRAVEAAARAAEGARLVLQVGLQRRYSPRYRASIALVRSGEAGRMRFVRAQWHAAGNPPRDKPWLFREARSGGPILEQATHQIDIFNWLLEAVPVRACVLGGVGRFANDPPGRDTPDHFGAVLEYPCGAHVQLSHLSFSIPDRRFAGIYELAFGERLGIDLGNAVAWTSAGATRPLLPGAAGGSGVAGPSDTQLALRSFLECVRAGGAPEAGLEAGLTSARAAILCQRALAEGRVAEWKEIDQV